MTKAAVSTTPPRRGGRPSQQAAGEIEGKIAGIARDLFFTYGYGATSIETIARAAGISKRTFYHRFENKAAIFKVVVSRLIQDLKPADMTALFKGNSGEEILLHLAEALLTASLAPETLALQRLLISEAQRFPELGLVMSHQGARQDAIDRIAAVLDGEVKKDILAIDDTRLAAEIFMQMVIGLPQRKALGLGQAMSGDELKIWAENALRIFLYGCKKHG